MIGLLNYIIHPMLILFYVSFFGVDYGTALELYTLTLEKMKAQKIFTTQAGLKIVDELTDADTVTRQQIGQYVINMKAKQDSEIVKNIQSISFDKHSSPALHH